MNPLQKILLAVAVLSVLIVVMRKAMAYQRAEREELDAEPLRPEPLAARQLRV